MIRNRFSVLLAEKGLKITRVSKDTGIARSTLNNISKNDTDMIRLDTINELCKYLGVTHCEFFQYEPLDLRFSMDVVSMPFESELENNNRILYCKNMEADLFMDIDWGYKTETIDLNCELTSSIVFKDNLPMSDLNKNIAINLSVHFDDKEKEVFFINEIYDKIDGSFYQDIYSSLIGVIIDGVYNNIQDNINHFIKNYLDFNQFPDGLSDEIFAKYLKSSLDNNLKFDISTDVFKPF